MRKKDYILLGIILLIALIFRLYKIDTPLADLHSWRQVDTAAVGRNFAKDGFDLLYPRYDDLSSIQTGYENPNGYRFVEFPIYSAIFGFLYRYLPITSLEVYGRLTSALFSLITLASMYYLVLKEKNRLAAVVATFTFATFPYFVFFSRVILPETTAVALMFLSLLTLYLYLKNEYSRTKGILLFVISVLSYAASILVKPTTIFYSFVVAYLFISTYKFDVVKRWQPYVFTFLGLIPFILWRLHIMNYPEGIPASSWLITTVNTFEGPQNIFFRPAFFRWIFMERIGIAIFGIYLSLFFFIGFVGKYKSLLLHVITLSGFVYLFTFQGGNVQHEYYQTILFPVLAIMVGTGVSLLLNIKNVFNKVLLYPGILAIFIISFLFSYYRVKDYYNYPGDLTQIAKLINTFTNEDDWIVTDRMGDTTLLYLAERKGAPAIYKDLPELKKMGYDYVVTANSELIDQLKEQKYTTIVENNQFALIKL